MTSLLHSTSEPSVVSLDPLVNQDNHWCMNCAGQRIFIAVFEVETGRLGFCLGCGEEKFLPFTRTVGEAA